MEIKETKIEKVIEDKIWKEVARVGIKMTKKISSGGFFSSPTWDTRTVYNVTGMTKLIKEGFSPGSDLGLITFNALAYKD